MTRILGLDPGSRLTGFGVIEVRGRDNAYLASGCIRVAAQALPEKLRIIHDGVSELIIQHQPQVMAVEKVFMHRNADSALKLGQARGAAICAAVCAGLAVSEYTPNQIKLSVVGTGHAAKEQMQHMVRMLLELPAAPGKDAADALAAALCHAHMSAGLDARLRGLERSP